MDNFFVHYNYYQQSFSQDQRAHYQGWNGETSYTKLLIRIITFSELFLGDVMIMYGIWNTLAEGVNDMAQSRSSLSRGVPASHRIVVTVFVRTIFRSFTLSRVQSLLPLFGSVLCTIGGTVSSSPVSRLFIAMCCLHCNLQVPVS